MFIDIMQYNVISISDLEKKMNHFMQASFINQWITVTVPFSENVQEFTITSLTYKFIFHYKSHTGLALAGHISL